MPRKDRIRVRFAPSPTGFLHVGSLRTALYNYLFARQNKGDFILRVEDTDRSRYVEGSLESLLKVLKMMGLEWGEGPFWKCSMSDVQCQTEERGRFGPYIQSQRLKVYQKYAEELVEKGRAYYCFCSEERLEKLRETQQQNRQPTRYDRHCRVRLGQGSDRNRNEHTYDVERSHVIRLAVPQEGKIQFNDLIRGRVEFENQLIDDQVLMKSDGFPTYHLANVVDDYEMKITHVIRGEEWLSSTPKHVLLYEAFGWPAPQFAHIPLLLNPDKSKLSKRQGDVAVEDYLKKGYLPEALLNFVALLGWNPGTDREIFSLEELIKIFDLTKVQKAGAVFDIAKLDWMNGEYLKRMPLAKLIKMCRPYLPINDAKKKIEKIIKLEQERLKKLSDLPNLAGFLFKLPDYPKEILIWRKSDAVLTLNRLQTLIAFFQSLKDWTKEGIEAATLDLIREKNLDNGATLWPLRVALSGQEKSPGPFEIADILGKRETIRRLRSAAQKLKSFAL